MIATTTLARVDNERLQRGVEGLTAGAYSITLTRQTEDEVSAYVANGDGKSYSVTLTEGRSFCGCGDAMFRGKTCKHSVALALYVIRTPETERAMVPPTPEIPLFHLAWTNGVVLCGADHPCRVQVYPCTASMVTWPEACPACVQVYQKPTAPKLAKTRPHWGFPA